MTTNIYLYVIVLVCWLRQALAMSECHREGPYVFSCEWPYWCCQDGISCCGISLYAYFGITLGFIGFLVLFGVALNIGLTRCRQPQFSVMPCVAVTKSSRSLYPKFQKGKTPNSTFYDYIMFPNDVRLV